jgi:hypothetical protein
LARPSAASSRPKARLFPAVGVDIGCGMMAVQTSLNARDLRQVVCVKG